MRIEKPSVPATQAPRTSLTDQLQRMAGGDRSITEEALRSVLPEIHRIAVRAVRRRDRGISPTELINEVWLRKLSRGQWRIASRQEFFAIVAKAMREVLVELARLRIAERRGGRFAIVAIAPFESVLPAGTADPESVIAIGMLMEKLEKRDPRAARIVDLHHFIGLTFDEIASLTGLKPSHIRNLWRKGSNYLKDRLAL